STDTIYKPPLMEQEIGCRPLVQLKHPLENFKLFKLIIPVVRSVIFFSNWFYLISNLFNSVNEYPLLRAVARALLSLYWANVH
ncbi:hypothetical protein, partial [Schinkia azotoformans]|uniref:hypothetical protein n=2 Tax=Schinkia azotoformans TaxID=1454 RepID=UPI002DB8FB8E